MHTQPKQAIFSNTCTTFERTPDLGFKAYDEQFRLKRAMDQSKSFGKIDDELWLIYMANTTCQSPNPITNNTRSQKCFNFNYRGVCKRPICKYQHTCMQCGLPHPVASHHNVALGTHDENNSTFQQNFGSDTHDDAIHPGHQHQLTQQYL